MTAARGLGDRARCRRPLFPSSIGGCRKTPFLRDAAVDFVEYFPACFRKNRGFATASIGRRWRGAPYEGLRWWSSVAMSAACVAQSGCTVEGLPHLRTPSSGAARHLLPMEAVAKPRFFRKQAGKYSTKSTAASRRNGVLRQPPMGEGKVASLRHHLHVGLIETAQNGRP
jgi:hypothetical protein